MSTSPEHTVLSALQDGNEYALPDLVEKTGISADALRRMVAGLEEKNHVKVTREKIVHWVLTKNGEMTIAAGSLPEQRLCLALEKKALEMKILQSVFPNSQEFSAAFGLAKRSNWIEVKSESGKTLVQITPLGKKSANNSPAWMALQSIARNEHLSEGPLVSELHARGLIAQKMQSSEMVSILPKGKDELKHAPAGKKSGIVIGQLTPPLLASGEWKKGAFKSYDVRAGVEPRFAGRIHPLRNVILDTRRIMVEMGFSEMAGPLVESAFWNMDSMFIPQDHPAREVQDTFYLPGKAALPDADLVKRVKALHEHGGKTGSKGFGYEWDPKIAMQLLLRTHTTATTFRELAKNPQSPQKKFAIGRIFRNEAIDATHLAEFHQVEGFIVGEGLTLRHLMGVIQEFYAKLGLTKIKFKPTYNPYTEPSMEALAFHPGLNKWVEIINSGMFRKESLAPYGIHVPVIAWGFGLERLALFVHQKQTLREIMGPEVDLDWIRRYAGTYHKLAEGK